MSQNSLPAAPKRPLLVILLVLISVVACGAAGYSWWLLQQHKNGAEPAAAKQQPPAAPVFMPLDTFTVNFGDAGQQPGSRAVHRPHAASAGRKYPPPAERFSAGSAQPSADAALPSGSRASWPMNKGSNSWWRRLRTCSARRWLRDNRSRWSATCCSPPSYCGNHYGR